MHRIIHIASNPGDVVLDCFAGSGTTAAVAHKMDRRWVTVEQAGETVDTFTLPRLEKVVAGDDPAASRSRPAGTAGAASALSRSRPRCSPRWTGASGSRSGRSTGRSPRRRRRSSGYEYEPDPPFAGSKGKTRLAVVDGLVNADVVELLVSALGSDERLVVCGTAVDPEATETLKTLRSGSRTRKIPASILAEYRIGREWRESAAAPVEPAPA
jgi:adenine-specific DNA-methyltransferase